MRQNTKKQIKPVKSKLSVAIINLSKIDLTQYGVKSKKAILKASASQTETTPRGLITKLRAVRDKLENSQDKSRQTRRAKSIIEKALYNTRQLYRAV